MAQAGLRRDLAEQALSRLARLLKMSLEKVAVGNPRVANAEMVKALRVISVERGHDPRDFVAGGLRRRRPDARGRPGGGTGHKPGTAARQLWRALSPGMVVGDQRRDWVRMCTGGGLG